MPKKPELQIAVLPKELVLPLLAAMRMIERTMNPSFFMILRCSKCGTNGAETVPSKKKLGSYIGIQCRSESCGQTIKFEEPLNFKSTTMPERLRNKPDSALEGGKVSKKWTKEVFDITIEGLDE